MLPLDLFGKSLSPPSIALPEENSGVLSSGALTPQKRTTTEPHASVPLAKRLQLSSESDNFDLFPEGSENSTMNVVLGRSFSPNQLVSSPSSLDSSNVVGTPAFITTLMMKFIKFDEQRQIDGEQAPFWQPLVPPNNADPLPLSNNNGPSSIYPTAFEGMFTFLNSAFNPLPIEAMANTRSIGQPTFGTQLALKKNFKSEIPKSRSENDCEMKDDDECLLSNLPTSVDDLQDMEQQIKLERQMNSPLTSHRQSPNYFEAGRMSAISGGSLGMDRVYSSASNHPDEELDADDMEVAMINESFEEQQRQYKLYCGEELKSAFYSAPVDGDLEFLEPQPQPYPMPVAVPDNDEPLYNNEAIYRWREDSSPQIQAFDTQLPADDLMSTVIPSLEEAEQKPIPPLHSTAGSSESFNLYSSDSSHLVGSSSRDILAATDEDVFATALSSANFVLGSLDSPHKTPSDLDPGDLPLMMNAKKKLEEPPESSEDEELAKAWETLEKSGTAGDNVRYYIPRNNVTPPGPPVLENLVEPPKNIKALGHVTEIYEVSGELDSEPMLQYFQSIGMKNFYQRDIDIQRAFLVFASVEEAKFAVENNKTKLQMRLLEESPQFVKMKALKMHMELLPCAFEKEAIQEQDPKASSWQQPLPEPIAGI
ncbi:hypothetical protein FO519_000669 [Halicephalobus sp. NKZ332]|nr:hypothetical protein FO519_000669 [Halicephalobus sp. NKZ332]